MKESWRSTFFLYSNTDEYKQSIALAKRNLHEIVTCHRKTYCSFSGGKDSTVLLWLAMQENPAMMALHIDFGRWLMPRPIYDAIIENAELQGCKPRVETSEKYENLAGDIQKSIFGPLLFGKIEPQLIGEGYDCCLLGLRAEESRKRAARTKAKSTGKIEATYPIAHMSWMDVWATIVSEKLPYLRYYDQQESIGIGYDHSRISTFYTDGQGGANVDAVLMPENLHQYE